jgi:alternate signal-mediated exported protein
MNKLTKGAIAAAAGVILLMGGAGTLASWNSSSAAGTSQTVTAGQLALTSTGTGTWKNAAGTTITPSTYRIVPGDTLTYTQTYNVAASGDNLFFTVAATPGVVSNAAGAANLALSQQVTSAASYSVTGNGITPATSANTYKVGAGTTASTVVVTMTLAFPYGSTVDNSAQLGVIALGAGAITLTQTATA